MKRLAGHRADHRAHRGRRLRGGRLIALVAAFAAGGCVRSGHLSQARAPAPIFDPIAFFSGRTEGRGTLTILPGRRQTTLVDGDGVVAPDGTIRLDQDVRRGNAAPTHRTWQLRRIGADRYAGTLTDARGPVTGDVSGNRLHLAFTTTGGLHVEQWLYLQPDGRTARNRMVVTKFGIPVASLDETIVRTGIVGAHADPCPGSRSGRPRLETGAPASRNTGVSSMPVCPIRGGPPGPTGPVRSVVTNDGG